MRNPQSAFEADEVNVCGSLQLIRRRPRSRELPRLRNKMPEFGRLTTVATMRSTSWFLSMLRIPKYEFKAMREPELVSDLAKLLLQRFFRASNNRCDLSVRAAFRDKSDKT
jgi:hypothetical protein